MSEIARAARLLRSGELVAFPTETVYGLGADASNPQAIARVFAAKGRPADHPLIVHLADADQLPRWAIDIPDLAYRLADAFWPGPLTLVLRRHPAVSDALTGGQDTVGIRVPRHPVALALLREFGGGIAAPSANRFGHVSPTTAGHVRDEFGESLGMVLDGGACDVGIESTILDLSSATPRILRPGMLVPDVPGVILDGPPGGADAAGIPRVSGSLASHYAPTTPLRLVLPEEVHKVSRSQLDAGRRIIVLATHRPAIDASGMFWQPASTDPVAYAHDLYANLRRFDAKAADTIIVERPPQVAEWLAVIDRLQRAAAAEK